MAKRVLVGYATRTGSTVGVAEAIGKTLGERGFDVEVKPLQRQAQTQIIWFSRDKWDVTMWRMVGRPERSEQRAHSPFLATMP